MAVVGFDFGTTNSLASVVIGTDVITFLENEQPIPSVVSFEGGKVEVGRKAHDKRQAISERDAKREIQKAIGRAVKGRAARR